MSSSRPSAPPAGPRPVEAPPCPCSRVRVELTGDQLRLTGSDLELTISVEVTVTGERRRRRHPAGPPRVRHRAGPARRQRRGRGRPRTRPASPPGRSEFSLRILPADEFPRLTEAAGEPVTLASAELAEALSPGRAGRRRATTPARSSPACCWPPRPAGCAWSPPTPTGWPIRDLPGTTVLAEGQHVLVPSRALQELARLLGRRRRRSRCAWASGRPPSRSAAPGSPPCSSRASSRTTSGSSRQAQPNRLTVGREALLDAVRRVKLLAREATPGAPGHVERRARAGGRHPGRRPGPREPRRQVRGHRAHRRLQPGVPRAGHRGHPRRRGHASRPSTPSSRRCSASPSTPSSSTC